MERSTARQTAVDFAWLLRNISLSAMDKLVNALKESRSLGAARLACRALRDAVDGSVRELHMTVLPQHRDMYLSHQLPPLERWPRCSSVAVSVSEETADAVGRGHAASLLTLPFTQLSPKRRPEITYISYEVKGLEPIEANFLPSLPIWVPCLRELQLHNLHLACDPLQLGLMYEAFASLTHLAVLTLPCFAALEGIAALGGGNGSPGSSSSSNGPRLRRLEVWDTINTSLEPQALSGLSQLCMLQHLISASYVHLTPGPGPDGSVNTHAAYSFVTADFAPSVESLEVKGYLDDYCGLVMKMDLCQGEMRSIDISPGVTLPGLLDMTVDVLLPSLQHGPRASRQQLERLSIDTLDVMGGEDLHLLDVAGVEQALQPLVHLRQRCRRCDLTVLCLYEAPQSSPEGTAAAALVEKAWQVVRRLGPPQWVLELRVTPRALESNELGQCVQYRNSALRVWTGCCQQQGEQTGAAAAALGWRRPVLLPDAAPAAVLQEALRRMEGQAPATAAAAGAGRVPSGAGGSDGAGGTGSGARTELLMLRGPFIATLCQTPDAIGPWLRALECCAATGGGRSESCAGHHSSRGQTASSAPPPSGSGADDSASAHRGSVRAYQLVPCARVLLVAFEAVGAHAAAASAAALRVEPEGAELQVLPLGIKWTWGERDDKGTLCEPLQLTLLTNIAQIIEDEFAAVCLRDGAGSGALTREYLEWARRVGDYVTRELPPAVVM